MTMFTVNYEEGGTYKASMYFEIEAESKEAAIEKAREMRKNDLQYDHESQDSEYY